MTPITLSNLRDEYRSVGERIRLLNRHGVRDDVPLLLRLQAREMEIVDELAAAGVPPDVLAEAQA